MSIFTKISAAVAAAAAAVGTAWHDNIEPWLGDFFKSVVHAEVDAVIPIATAYVQQAVPALVAAAASGNFQGFADAQWDAVVNTAEEAKKQAITAGISSVATAVNALISSHPDVIAANEAAAAASQAA